MGIVFVVDHFSPVELNWWVNDADFRRPETQARKRRKFPRIKGEQSVVPLSSRLRTGQGRDIHGNTNFPYLSVAYSGARGRNRTTDTRIFNPLLYP